MSSGQKVSFSFLTALILFVGFVAFANPRIFGIKKDGLLSTIETDFYKQSKISEKQAQLDKLTDYCNSYILNILKKIENSESSDDNAFLKDESVKTFLDIYENPNVKIEEIARKRYNRVTQLQQELPGIQFRVIDNNKSNRTDETSNRHRIYYSTFDKDIISNGNNRNSTFKNYDDIGIKTEDDDKLQPELPAKLILTDGDRPQNKIFIDKENKRLIVSIPFYRYEKVCDATLVCYFNLSYFIQYLMDNNALLPGENFDPITGTDLENKKTNNISGFVSGIPHDIFHDEESIAEFEKPILKSWENESSTLKFERILEGDGFTWLIMNNKSSDFFVISTVYKSSIFELPSEIKIFIYIVTFISLLLICFLIFSIKRGYITVIRSRIKKVQLEIIKEYLDNHDKVEWNAVALQIAARKDDLNEEIKKNIGIKNNKSRKFKKYNELTDTLLEASWDEILTVIGGKVEKSSESLSGATIDEIRKVLEEVLQSTELNINVAKVSKTQIRDADVIEDAVPADDLEDVEEIDEIESVEEIDEVEDVESIEEIEDTDSTDEVEEIENVDSAETIEEIEDTDSAGEVEEIENVDSAETIEEVEDTDTTDEIEEKENDIFDNSKIEEVNLINETDVVSINEGTDLQNAVSDKQEELEDLLEEIPEEISPVYVPEIIDFNTSSIINGYETFCSYRELNFATVDSIFAEDLCIGAEYTPVIDSNNVKDYDFKIFTLEFGTVDSENSICEEMGTDPEKNLINSSSVLPEESENFITSEIQGTDLSIQKDSEIDSFQNVLDELRDEVAEKTVEEELSSDGIEELPEVIIAPVAKSITKEKRNTGSARTLFTMTNAYAFGLSQEIGELEDASDELIEVPFEVETEELSPLLPEEMDEVVDDVSELEPSNELDSDMPEKIKTENMNSDTIIENEGIFSISKNLPYNSVEIDQSFKDLVDSVLR